MTKKKRVRRSQSRQTQTSKSRLWSVLTAVAFIFGVLGFLFFRSVLGSPTVPADASNVATPATDISTAGPGEAVTLQGAPHVQPGQSHPEYNSDPPTSGWHLGRPILAGFYEEPQVDEAVVHNLEHGHVVIAYDCSKLTDCEGVKAKLKDLVNRYESWKVIVMPRDNKDAAIALTAWGRIDKLDDYDEARITAFIDAYRDQGPEKTPQ